MLLAIRSSFRIESLFRQLGPSPQRRMANPNNSNIAIIGASIAGLTLALSLHEQHIPCSVYEHREASYLHGGAINLTPNASRILDRLGAHTRLSDCCYHFRFANFVNEDHVKQDQLCFGNKDLYNYDGLRIYRSDVLRELRTMLQERQIPIHYNARYKSIVSESAIDGVDFELDDGSIHHASMLVGADGIHSRVRNYLTGAQPEYMGIMAIAFECDTSRLRFPTRDHELPVSITGEKGAYVIAPQNHDGSKCFVGTQWEYPEETREKWNNMLQDTDGLIERLHADYDSWGDLAKSALENIKRETMFLWPFYSVSHLESWISKIGRIVIIGDAAHSIPPALAQGANQAFEDGYALALLLGGAAPFGGRGNVTLDKVLKFWQQYRGQRVAKVMDLTRKMNNRRLPAARREALPRDMVWNEENDGKLDWLYAPHIEETIRTWLDEPTTAQAMNIPLHE